jgi:hypothetical protein
MLKLFGGEFRILDPRGNTVLFAKMKAFKLREDIRLFTGDDMLTEVMLIKARGILDISTTYDVTDITTNEKIGALKRKGLKSSFLKDEWMLLDNYDNEIGLIKEDSLLLAIIRRQLTALIPQKFHAEMNGSQVCLFQQNFNPFTLKLNVDFSPDMQRQLDKRLGLAAAVLLCAIEGRQR